MEAGTAAQVDTQGGLREHGRLYEETRSRIVRLMTDVGDEEASRRVPACPEWTLKDLLAHLTGVCADVLAGNVMDAAAPTWTAAQVEARRGDSLEEVIAEWNEAAPQVATFADDFPGRFGQQFVADVTVHEHDLRGALEQPGFRDSDSVALATEFLLAVFFHPALLALGLGPLEVAAGDRTWVVGTAGPPIGNLESGWREALLADALPIEASGSPAGRLEVDPFELFRALTGRRSAAQIVSYDWSVDATPYLPCFGAGPFTLRASALEE